VLHTEPSRNIQVGLYAPENMPISFKNCIANILPHFSPTIEVKTFTDVKLAPPCDLLWDPRGGGGIGPIRALLYEELPYVMTVHGVAPLEVPWRYAGSVRDFVSILGENRRKKRLWRLWGSKVNAVVTVSQYARESIIKHLPIDSSDIFVAPNGISTSTFRRDGRLHNGKYFLHVSNGEPRKNILNIMRAHKEVFRETGVRLVVKAPVEGVPPAGVDVIRDHLSEHDLAELYQNAICFVFPSFYEGFGLPILEAMAVGCPVLTSNTTACNEVAGEAAIRVNPADPRALASAMKRIYVDLDLRDELRQRGYSRIQQYSWETPAAVYEDVFRRVIG
jgi:glycosyltransferase involved in cell wall biosynthesis